MDMMCPEMKMQSATAKERQKMQPYDQNTAAGYAFRKNILNECSAHWLAIIRSGVII
jgi:hypothetical protein